jgi:hypothetical protein
MVHPVFAIELQRPDFGCGEVLMEARVFGSFPFGRVSYVGNTGASSVDYHVSSTYVQHVRSTLPAAGEDGAARGGWCDILLTS